MPQADSPAVRLIADLSLFLLAEVKHAKRAVTGECHAASSPISRSPPMHRPFAHSAAIRASGETGESCIVDLFTASTQKPEGPCTTELSCQEGTGVCGVDRELELGPQLRIRVSRSASLVTRQSRRDDRHAEGTFRGGPQPPPVRKCQLVTKKSRRSCCEGSSTFCVYWCQRC